jgi:transcriptional regulator with XRE-family HTH domain
MELRMFRETLPKDLASGAVARALGWSPSKISRIEQARTPVTRPSLEKLLEYYTARHGMTAKKAKAIRGLFGTALDTGRGHPYLGPAAAAPLVREWAPLLVPRLLQVPEYTGAVLTALQPVTHMPPSEIALTARAVTRWQLRLAVRPPRLLHAVLDESVLTRTAGGPDVMAAQLEYLAQLGGDGPVQVRVLPLCAAMAPRWASGFRCLQYADEVLATRIETDELEGPGQPAKTDDGQMEWRRQLLFAQLWDAAEPAGPVIRKVLDAGT